MATRRRLLGAIVAGFCSGCVGGSGVNCLSVTVAEGSPVDIFLESTYQPGEGIGSSIVTNASEGGTVHVPDDATSELSETTYVWYDETLYRLRKQGRYTDVLHRLVVDFRGENGQQAPADETVREFDELPAVDQAALQTIRSTAKNESQTEDGLSLEGEVVEYPDGFADSALAAEGEYWIRWERGQYKLTVTGTNTLERGGGERHEVERHAESRDGVRQHLEDRYQVSLDNLTETERDILDTAIDEGRFDECEKQEAYERFRGRLPSEKEFQSLDFGWHIAYNGERYLIDVERYSDYL